MRVSGLGFLKGTYCPHFIGEGRDNDFRAMMRKYGGVGYGIDNGAALVWEAGKFRAIRIAPEVVANRLAVRRGRLVEEPL